MNNAHTCSLNGLACKWQVHEPVAGINIYHTEAQHNSKKCLRNPLSILRTVFSAAYQPDSSLFVARAGYMNEISYLVDEVLENQLL